MCKKVKKGDMIGDFLGPRPVTLFSRYSPSLHRCVWHKTTDLLMYGELEHWSLWFKLGNEANFENKGFTRQFYSFCMRMLFLWNNRLMSAPMLFLCVSRLPKLMILILLSIKPFLYDIPVLSYDHVLIFGASRQVRNIQVPCGSSKNLLKPF